MYDGGNPIVELDSSGNVANVNVFAPDGLVARKEGSTWTNYTFDQQGSVVHKLDSSQTITAGRLLDAWGTGVETTLPRNIDPFGYNAKWGYYYDRETSLYLCQNRMYDASAGRFINRDPIGYAGGVNLYGYCGGGPVGNADPSGCYEVRLGWHEVFGGAYHSFVLVTDNDKSSETYGWTWGFSAGPQRHGVESVTDAGEVTDRSGLYNKHHYDSRSRHPGVSSWPIQRNCEPVGPLLNLLDRARRVRDDADWPYNLLRGPNSNTFARFITEAVGMHERSNDTPEAATRVIEDLERRKGYEFPGWLWWPK